MATSTRNHHHLNVRNCFNFLPRFFLLQPQKFLVKVFTRSFLCWFFYPQQKIVFFSHPKKSSKDEGSSRHSRTIFLPLSFCPNTTVIYGISLLVGLSEWIIIILSGIGQFKPLTATKFCCKKKASLAKIICRCGIESKSLICRPELQSWFLNLRYLLSCDDIFYSSPWLDDPYRGSSQTSLLQILFLKHGSEPIDWHWTSIKRVWRRISIEWLWSASCLVGLTSAFEMSPVSINLIK